MNHPFFDIYIEAAQMCETACAMLDGELQREDGDPIVLNAMADLTRSCTSFMSVCHGRALDEKPS